MNSNPDYAATLKKMIAKNILFFLSPEKINWYEEVQIRPARILKTMTAFIHYAIEQINVGIKDDRLLKTFRVYEELIQLLRENPDYLISESVDFSHGYEYMATIENETNGSLVNIVPFWDTHEMEFLLKTGIFKKIDSQDLGEGLMVCKYKLL